VLVVLILHLVAVGGIYAFSSIKAHRIAESPEPVEKKENFDGTAKKNATAPDATSASKVQRNASALPDKSSDSSPKKSATTSSKNALKDSGETYIVAKGDKLAAIAKKLKVNADDLLKLNKIDDPKTLQIGRKLRIPVKRQPSDS
jgi:LysM repeat protein